MENAPAYDIVFLNELHDKLKRLDSRRDPHAGMYRILGRLAEYDPVRQIVKVESCFHHQYTPSIKAQASCSSYKAPVSMKNETAPGYTVPGKSTINLNRPKGGEAQTKYQNQGPNTGPVNNVGRVDLTSTTDEDSLDDEATPVPVKVPQKRKITILDPRQDTISSLESSNLPHRNRKRHQYHHPADCFSKIQMGGPKIVLWVSTALLNRWRFERQALFQFIGDVIFEAGHWTLEAKTCRNMEGLDLFTYRESILLMRALVQQVERDAAVKDMRRTSHLLE